MRICFPRRWVSCPVSSQHSVSKMCWVWIPLQPPSVFHSLGVLREKETVDMYGTCWHKEQRALCRRRRVLAPRSPRDTAPVGSAVKGRTAGARAQRAAGILGTGVGNTMGRKHSRRIVCNLRRPGVKEVSSRHSKLKFTADLWDACPQQLLLLPLPFECLSPPLLFSCFTSSLCLIPCWGPLLGKAQLNSGQLLLSCMNSVDAKCWLENILYWIFIGSSWFLGAEGGGSNRQNYSLAWKRKNEIPPPKLHTC